MVQATTRSVVDRYVSKPRGEFADSVTPKLWVADEIFATTVAASLSWTRV